MTNERYAFVEDVKNRKNVARSGGKKGKSRYGCSLPVDYMTTKEKRDANSRWISVTYDRPISFDKFLAYSDDDKKKYLQTIIDKYAGDTGKIAKMFGCTEAKIKKFRQDFDIKSDTYNSIFTKQGLKEVSDALWNEFIFKDEFLRKPMSYEDFKILDWYDQTQYIKFLNETMGATLTKISVELFKRTQGTLGLYLNNHHIAYIHRGRGYRMSKEQAIAWEEWLRKNDEPEQKTEETEELEQKTEENYAPMNAPDEETQAVEEPKETESYVIPSMQAHFRIDSQDQIIELLSKLPKAKKGQIFFIWGKED